MRSVNTLKTSLQRNPQSLSTLPHQSQPQPQSSMKLTPACYLLFPLLLPLNAQAHKISTTQKDTVQRYVIGDIYQNLQQPKAFTLDTALWPIDPVSGYFKIPVCWENLTDSSPVDRYATRVTLTNSWQKQTLVKFVGWGVCTENAQGIRITTVDNEYSPQAALGTEGDGKIGVTLLNFSMTQGASANLYAACQANNPSLPDDKALALCIKSTVIHEFGHVLGLAHEHHRDDGTFDDLSLCHLDPPAPADAVGPFTLSGNNYFTDYDTDSVMNYCRTGYAGRTNLTSLDMLAARVHYGQIPSYDSRSRILTIPRLNHYDGKAYESTWKFGEDNKFRLVDTLNETHKPSKSPATLSKTGALVLKEMSYISASGHVNQILKATLQETKTPGVFTKTWSRIQPTDFKPRP